MFIVFAVLYYLQIYWSYLLMSENNQYLQELVSCRTRRRIMTGVTAGHFLVLVLVLTFSVVSEWLSETEVETIAVEFYDPALTNVVKNPSPDPSPDNPIPPSGTQDGNNAPEDPAPEQPQVDPEPPKQLQPDPVKSVVQPQVTQRKLPRKPSKPKQVTQSKVKSVKQPSVTKRKRPGRNKNKAANNPNNNNKGKPGPRGSNRAPGHTAPGGQRGNSGYDQLVAGMIYRMWVTPDKNRMGGREPQVTIEVEIASDGRVTAKRILRRSGVLAMDESIQNLLDNLRQVMVPFDRKPHILRFALKAE